MPVKTKTNFAPRPPIIVVLGHVDHGKTSILDKIRQMKVSENALDNKSRFVGTTELEAGGITQHIGAYQAEHNSKKITFLDTPGHEAFSAIRSRGAKVADIAILVIDAEESVKPQTKEAIQIIKKAGIPFVVAINKIDKEGANPARVRQELAEQEVQVEDYGGNIPVVELSARSGKGINELLDMIQLMAEMEELSAPLDTPAKGVVIESHMDGRRGLVATLIVHEGEIRIGNWISAGSAIGKVKSLYDFLGKPINFAAASQPCVMLGWETSPRIGVEFQVAPDKESAQKLAASLMQGESFNLFAREKSTEEEKSNKKIAQLIIKADVQSSLEAIDQVLKTIHSEEVAYNVASYGIGLIGDNDIKNAKATKAAVIGFHVGIDSSAKRLAERDSIKVQTFEVIYELVEAVRLIMADLLDPEIKRIPMGKLKILATFKHTGKSQIIGGKVVQGKLTRGTLIDVMRNGTLVSSGKLGQLQHNKADVAEVSEGLEAGIRFDMQFQPMPQQLAREGDVLEVYQEEKIKRTI